MDLFKALSDENRLRILNLLSIKPLCVCELEVLLSMSQSNVSRHLGKLKSVGLIKASKDAQWVHYELDTAFEEAHEKLISYLRDLWSSEACYKKDTVTYSNYMKANLSCKDIAEERDWVVKKIQTQL